MDRAPLPDRRSFLAFLVAAGILSPAVLAGEDPLPAGAAWQDEGRRPGSPTAWTAAPRPWSEAPLGPAPGPVLAATWNWGPTVCEIGARVLAGGGDLLDALEQGINAVELDPAVSTVGLGGLPDEDGRVTLDAMIMRGSDLATGAVAALEDVPLAVSVARRVMERTRHVLLVGQGARTFALRCGFHPRELLTDAGRARWLAWRSSLSPRDNWVAPGEDHDTVGAVGLDGKGEAACAVSTSGLAFKIHGRVGDSPIVGAGGYADAAAGAAAATGVGEEAIRLAACHAVVEGMRAGLDPTEAIRRVLLRHRRVRPSFPGQLAIVAVRADGRVGASALRPRFVVGIHRSGRTGLYEVPPLS